MGGMRDHGRVLSFAPRLPRQFDRLAFSLLWRGPREPLLAQGIYTLAAPAESEALGRLDLFLVPLGPDGGSAGEDQGLLYEAVFT